MVVTFILVFDKSFFVLWSLSCSFRRIMKFIFLVITIYQKWSNLSEKQNGSLTIMILELESRNLGSLCLFCVKGLLIKNNKSIEIKFDAFYYSNKIIFYKKNNKNG